MTYVHYAFTHHPVNCLKHLTARDGGDSWPPHDGIIRVEVLRNAAVNYSLMDSYHKEFTGYKDDLYDESFTKDNQC